WAWLSEDCEADVLSTGRALHEEEWHSGDRLFFNTCITSCDNTREILRDMTHNVFPNEVATSLRRNPDSSVRRVSRWTGINLRRFNLRSTNADVAGDVQSMNEQTSTLKNLSTGIPV
ncbi:toxin-activating lysine-acyltransferase, partial [Ruegeria atlantica]|uniref:toxin-activating lysine-acyltransferase n=1 Tax=Ruegeria atlantica TaxID=81569 RepID=UPI00147CB0EF